MCMKVLASLAQWVEYWPSKSKIAASVACQGACLGRGPCPLLGHVQEATNRCFFHISIFLSLSFSLSSDLSKINKIFKKGKEPDN